MDQLKEEVIRSMHQFRELKPLVCSNGLSRGKIWLMGVTWKLSCKREDHMVRVSDIVASTGIPAPGVSRILKGLEADGMLVRVLNPSDRRTTLVSITEKGQTERQKAMRQLDAVLGTVIDAMGEDNVRALCKLLDEFYTQTEEAISRMNAGNDSGTENSAADAGGAEARSSADSNITSSACGSFTSSTDGAGSQKEII
ncbi:MAG: MarR family winged helix-turn-helix transcriptional regulator [Eubacterium sp.]|nr:MarR family winged helix-turn-helix transcriptional regulator [Eubacterium sp.]